MRDNLDSAPLAQQNATTLDRELAWFSSVLEQRFTHYFSQPVAPFVFPPAPDLAADDSPYATAVRDYGMGPEERLVVMLALAPHLRPQVLDLFFVQNKLQAQRFTEFGGWKGRHHEGFLPTCETAAFVLAGDDLARRFAAMSMFDDEHLLVRRRVLRIEAASPSEPLFSATLGVTREFLLRCTTGAPARPDASGGFPAKRITTRLTWDDLVLAPETRYEIDNLCLWLRQSSHLLRDWGLERAVKPGYRCLFYGPPGTGKTLSATLIGAAAGVDVYRIDLSMLISKYIGETEKNLANVFDQAQDKNWVLFFDEADALFGKRTEGNTSNDRHANQEISYLLQRVEDFPGVVILASNLKGNIDQAFARRFQSAIFFGMPDERQRLLLWEGMFDDGTRLDGDVRLEVLAAAHELSGGAMTNVVRYAAICASRQGRKVIKQADLLQGITKELIKEGRAF